MDYEQKYKEALEKLQEALAPTEDGCKISGLTRGCIENIFPELKESEDERMIERLKSCVYASDITPEGREEIFAWLEKQGKKLNVDEVTDWLDYNICNAYDYDGNDVSSTLKEKFIKDFKL